MKLLRRRVTLPFSVRCISDLHIGSPDVDYGMLSDELRSSDRIAINGDVFDLILPKDHKRYRPTAVHRRLRDSDDIVNDSIDWAVELLSPVARRIDFIGDGNHEDVVIQHGAVNPVKMLVQRLNTECKAHISYGGLNGFLNYYAKDFSHTIYYHHGAGGGGTLSSAVSNITSKLSFIDADSIWLGHRHHRFATESRRIGGDGSYRTVQLFMSGSYMNTYAEGRESYGSRKNLATQGVGGVTFSVDSEGKCSVTV